MSDILQVTTDPNRAASLTQTALRRRPNVGIKSVLDTSILNETLGPKTAQRDGRSEYQGKGVPKIVRQPAFHEVWRLECKSWRFNSRECSIAIRTSYELDYRGIEVHYPRWQRSFSSPMYSTELRGSLSLLPSRNGDIGLRRSNGRGLKMTPPLHPRILVMWCYRRLYKKFF